MTSVELTATAGSADADKFVIALRKGLPPGRAANVTTHLSLGLVAAASRHGGTWLTRMRFADFVDADGTSHTPVSTLGAIILVGRPAWLRTLRAQAGSIPALSVDFTELMTIGTADQQLRAMASTREPDLDYYGVGVFGPATIIDPLTRKFSLYA